jgi:hypothetical protein
MLYILHCCYQYTVNYESEDPPTWKSICLKCNAAYSLATPVSLVVPDSCIYSRKLSYVNVIVYLYSICKIELTVIGFYTVGDTATLLCGKYIITLYLKLVGHPCIYRKS